ncbi:type 1 glutamine amidotransferase domain-containing protein [soil metagenome]
MSTGVKNVALVIANNYEDVEADSPKAHLEALGAKVTVIGATTDLAKGKKGGSLQPDLTFADTSVSDYDMLIIPGGGAPENLRIVDAAVEFTRAFMESGKPVAAICHGPQLLISAEVLPGRVLTAVNKIRDDIRNAGGSYVDEALVIDGNLITSRIPADLDVFNDALAEALDLA